eukprot:GAHX01001126.1.p1 GENE.GAHX01001126.1~~GAHX01001126.1.p1  ORF type:complete len:122 (-),score=27.42 GAHX01001126.1:29-394(-)
MQELKSENIVNRDIMFCNNCEAFIGDGSMDTDGVVVCGVCNGKFELKLPERLLNQTFSYNLMKEEIATTDEKVKAAVIDYFCSKCKNDKATYTTFQTRGADEGQTVFYTCTKCGYKTKASD